MSIKLQVIARVIVEYHSKLQKNHALLNRVTNATSQNEQVMLQDISKKMKIYATLLPIRSVGVQGKEKTNFLLRILMQMLCMKNK